jgi:TolB-like protein/DNA-binding winged helix-turn-helix (wHTH) protein/Flp pilus assembly protein TadD
MNRAEVLGSPDQRSMTGQIVRFGTFELDRSTGELRSRGTRVSLQDQPAQVLSVLVSRPGEVVTRDELRKALWAVDTFVDFDTALNVAVNKVRQALGDSATTPRFVETVPTHGYRFLADLHPVEPEALDAAPRGPASVLLRRRGSPWMVASAVVALLAVSLFVLSDRGCRKAASAPPRSVAVLPFKPLVADARDEALEIGMAEAVIVKLGQRPALRVPSISAVRRYREPAHNPLQAGRELGVETVLDGSLQRADGRLRVSARLLDVSTGMTRWAQQWDIPWTDVFTVQDAMATEVTRALAPALGAGERVPAAKAPTNAAAYDRYLRGRYLATWRSLADSRRAATLLEEAVALDPNSAAARAVLADAYVGVSWMGGQQEPFPERARQAARRSLELDPNEATAHATLGIVLALFDWDTASGERELKRALELGPDVPAVLRFNSVFLWYVGRFEEASALNARELALDPTSVVANRNKAYILYYWRRYEDCIAQTLKTLELDRSAGSTYSLLASSYEQLGREREAIDAYIKPLTFDEEHQKDVAALRAAAAEGGARSFWACNLDQVRGRPKADSAMLAWAHLKVGDHDQAIAWLERISERRGPWLHEIDLDPDWDPLRADPRFQAWRRKANVVGSAP